MTGSEEMNPHKTTEITLLQMKGKYVAVFCHHNKALEMDFRIMNNPSGIIDAYKKHQDLLFPVSTCLPQIESGYRFVHHVLN